MRIYVYFFNQPCLELIVDDTKTGRLFFDLNQRLNQQIPAYYKDTKHYTPEYMVQLAHQAKEAFGWDWFSDTYDITSTTKLHKDLENYVGQLSFENIPEQYDDLLYDLHHCLHAIQFGKPRPGRFDHFQIEWLTDESVPLPACFEFKEKCNFGDLILINPYVGHNPLQIYKENDFLSLSTTCRFHDIIKPGIVISHGIVATKDEILNKFKESDPGFVQLHGESKIRYYSGSAVIGRVDNINIFKQILDTNDTLVLDRVEFYD